MSTDPLSEFWSWFAAHVGTIARGVTMGDGGLVREIDRRFTGAVPGGRWEIGPDSDDTWFFAVALNGRLDALERNRAIVAAAPPLPHWRFLPSKPRKRWARRVITFGDRTLDFDLWRFAWDEGIVGFVPGEEDARNLSSDELEGACWLFLESELGELEALETIEAVERVEHGELGAGELREAVMRGAPS